MSRGPSAALTGDPPRSRGRSRTRGCRGRRRRTRLAACARGAVRPPLRRRPRRRAHRPLARRAEPRAVRRAARRSRLRRHPARRRQPRPRRTHPHRSAAAALERGDPPLFRSPRPGAPPRLEPRTGRGPGGARRRLYAGACRPDARSERCGGGDPRRARRPRTPRHHRPRALSRAGARRPFAVVPGERRLSRRRRDLLGFGLCARGPEDPRPALPLP